MGAGKAQDGQGWNEEEYNFAKYVNQCCRHLKKDDVIVNGVSFVDY